MEFLTECVFERSKCKHNTVAPFQSPTDQLTTLCSSRSRVLLASRGERRATHGATAHKATTRTTPRRSFPPPDPGTPTVQVVFSPHVSRPPTAVRSTVGCGKHRTRFFVCLGSTPSTRGRCLRGMFYLLYILRSGVVAHLAAPLGPLGCWASGAPPIHHASSSSLSRLETCASLGSAAANSARQPPALAC